MKHSVLSTFLTQENQFIYTSSLKYFNMQSLIKLSFLSLVLLFGFTSCGNDDCEPGTLSETIVGTWKYASSMPGTFEFQADGTLIDPDGAILEGEVNGVMLEEKSWRIDADGNLILRAASGGTFQESTLMVDGFECDKITLSAFGFPVQIERT